MLVWCCVLMTTSHSSSRWKFSYICMKKTLWVWSGWGAVMRCSPMTNQRLRIAYFHHCKWDPAISGLELHPMTTDHSRRCWNTLYMYVEDLLLSMNWVGCLSIKPNTCYSYSPKWRTHISYSCWFYLSQEQIRLDSTATCITTYTQNIYIYSLLSGGYSADNDG
jgi:hypothetical protein